jgi:hypothetical protein
VIGTIKMRESMETEEKREITKTVWERMWKYGAGKLLMQIIENFIVHETAIQVCAGNGRENSGMRGGAQTRMSVKKRSESNSYIVLYHLEKTYRNQPQTVYC